MIGGHDFMEGCEQGEGKKKCTQSRLLNHNAETLLQPPWKACMDQPKTFDG